jgi:hypothetical protein
MTEDLYVVVTSRDGVYGVFTNPNVAHAWMTDHHPRADVFQVKRPELLPDLFLIDQQKTGA